MRIRPYIEFRDYEYVEKWIDTEKTHALWCAGLIPYPMTMQSLHDLLERNARDWMDSAYVATEDDGTVVGFFCYSINTDNNEGFLKLIVVDPAKRGRGYGRRMLELALQYAFCITGQTRFNSTCSRRTRRQGAVMRRSVLQSGLLRNVCFLIMGYPGADTIW